MNIWATWVENDGRFCFSLSNNGGTMISVERHAELLSAEASGQVLLPDGNGVPSIVEPQVSIATLQQRERLWRAAELERHEWIVMRHRGEVELKAETTLTAAQYAELLNYRKALRDWPTDDTFPDTESRPLAPVWLSGLSL